ncbi:hypothetical protein C2E23DRAFT_223163 [Lenzites betulinus]|nr:hypothetical protein C2E23DRAFT_223163 [Lenzites betulinus]
MALSFSQSSDMTFLGGTAVQRGSQIVRGRSYATSEPRDEKPALKTPSGQSRDVRAHTVESSITNRLSMESRVPAAASSLPVKTCYRLRCSGHSRRDKDCAATQSQNRLRKPTVLRYWAPAAWVSRRETSGSSAPLTVSEVAKLRTDNVALPDAPPPHIFPEAPSSLTQKSHASTIRSDTRPPGTPLAAAGSQRADFARFINCGRPICFLWERSRRHDTAICSPNPHYAKFAHIATTQRHIWTNVMPTSRSRAYCKYAPTEWDVRPFSRQAKRTRVNVLAGSRHARVHGPAHGGWTSSWGARSPRRQTRPSLVELVSCP